MTTLFIKYTMIGIINTLIHWSVFGVCLYVLCTSQAFGNFLAFCIAVTFSFFANARFTFNSSATTRRYILYIGFMGVLSALTGWIADKLSLYPLFTLVIFSMISLVCGFVYSKIIVFTDA